MSATALTIAETMPELPPVPDIATTEVSTRLGVKDQFTMPRMEICFQNLSVSVEVSVAEQRSSDVGSGVKLPTVFNAMQKTMSVNGRRSKTHVERRPILRDVSGCVKPGTITLVLGRPGSGKSTLLKALGGQLPFEGGNRVDVDGQVTYNGTLQSDLPAELPRFVGYVGQNDDHFATLTVKETLQFAYEFAGGSTNGAAESATQPTPEQVISLLGLGHCQDTILGDATALRGVSGGERKRVTLGEGLFGNQSVLLLDEISTGLDAAATLDIIRLLKHTFAVEQHRAVVISLLQPTPEVFALFDEVLLLNAGEMLYYGPREAVSAHFAALGLSCPQERPVADFLLDLGTSQQAKYEAIDHPSGLPPVAGSDFETNSTQLSNQQCPRSPQELAAHFQHSTVHLNTLAAMANHQAAAEGGNPPKDLALAGAMPAFPQSFWRNTLSLTRRQLILVRRNVAFLRARGFMTILMGLIYGSAFFQASPTDIQLVLGLCFQSVLFLLLGQTAQIASFVEARVVLAKQRRAQLTRSTSYVLACCAGQLPAALAETVVFGSLAYWLSGLDFDTSASSLTLAARFLAFEGLLFLTLLAAIAWFFIVAAISSDRNVAFPVAMASIVAFIIFSGFAVPKGQFPDWLIWGYWLDPLAWALRAIAVNAYRSPTMDQCVYNNVNYCQLSDEGLNAGEYYLSRFDVPSATMWAPLAAAFLLAAYAVFMIMAWLMLERMCQRHTEDSATHRTPLSTSSSIETDEGYALVLTPRADGPTSNDGATCAVAVKTEALAGAIVPVTLGFEDVWYSVPAPASSGESNSVEARRVDLLKGISGYALPGTMTALMGSSGAGKTTLLDVLAGRKSSGSVRGRVLLNGREASDLAVRRCTGYCEQIDVHSDASTIREALLFSALLRQESAVPEQEKLVMVEECLDLLDLTEIADEIIRGRSHEQLKRVSIGVELAARNSVLFLDEPTSGLDAQAAAVVMRSMRRAADLSRCTIVCTIHQPSASVFELFDQLLLLQLGGEVVYFGDSGVNALVDYFEGLPGVTPLPRDYNPATWILECIGAGVTRTSDTGLDFAQHFKASEQNVQLSKALEDQQKQLDVMVELNFSAKRAASSWTQMRLLIARFRTLYWRTPSYSLSRMFLAVALGLIIGVLFSGADYASYQGINAGVGGMFLSVSFSGTIAINSVLPLAVQDRAAFYRERSAQSYNALWYFLGATLAEIPYVIVSSLIFTVLSFTIMGFTSGGDASWGLATIALYWLVLALFTLQQVYLGQFLAYALPGVELASLGGMLLSSLLFLFAGFNPPSSGIPQGYRWLHVLSPQRYSLAALVALVFADCSSIDDAADHFGCQTLQNTPLELEGLTVKQYVESVFEMKHDDVALNVVVSLIFAIGFQLLGLISLRFISHQRK